MKRAVGGVAAGVGYATRLLIWLVAQIPFIAGPVMLWLGLRQSPWPWTAWVVLGAVFIIASVWPTKKGAQ